MALRSLNPAFISDLWTDRYVTDKVFLLKRLQNIWMHLSLPLLKGFFNSTVERRLWTLLKLTLFELNFSGFQRFMCVECSASFSVITSL